MQAPTPWPGVEQARLSELTAEPVPYKVSIRACHVPFHCPSVPVQHFLNCVLKTEFRRCSFVFVTKICSRPVGSERASHAPRSFSGPRARKPLPSGRPPASGSPNPITQLCRPCVTPRPPSLPFGNVPVSISHLRGIWQMSRIWIKPKVFGMPYKALHDLELCCCFFFVSSDLYLILYNLSQPFCVISFFPIVCPVPGAWNLPPLTSLTVVLPGLFGTLERLPLSVVSARDPSNCT